VTYVIVKNSLHSGLFVGVEISYGNSMMKMRISGILNSSMHDLYHA
jgi:hypothetical protein